jgi:DNA repair protein RadA/Sms
MEVQALVTESPMGGNPRRNCVGYDPARLAMLVSIIEKKLHIPYYKHDIFLNITSGLMLKEPAADLPVAAVLISSMLGIPLPSDLMFLGEVGLTGEIRPLTFLQRRISESQRHGFTTIIIPAFQVNELKMEHSTIRGIEHIREMMQIIKSRQEKKRSD